MTKNALIVFARNPELGKCKTRLAKVIGDNNALEVYKHLINHTAEVTAKVNCHSYVFYSESITKNDLWDDSHFNKRLQQGEDLGERMKNAFESLFNEGYKKVVIVGSDLLDLNEDIIEKGFKALDTNDIIIGPAEDGGYYLLGMKTLHPTVFNVENWGTETVYRQTKSKLIDNSVYVLEMLNDIDNIEDLKPYKVFEKYL